MAQDPERQAIEAFREQGESYEAALARASKAAVEDLALERAPLQNRLEELKSETAVSAIKVMALDAMRTAEEAEREREMLRLLLTEAEDVKTQIEQIETLMARCSQAVETYGV